VFVRDLVRGTTERVSVSSKGKQGNDESGILFEGEMGPPQGDPPALSAGGRFVAFTSQATNLVPGDTNGQSDVFVAPSPAMRTGAAQPPAGKAKRGR
jgi:hypothetical protein